MSHCVPGFRYSAPVLDFGPKILRDARRYSTLFCLCRDVCAFGAVEMAGNAVNDSGLPQGLAGPCVLGRGCWKPATRGGESPCQP